MKIENEVTGRVKVHTSSRLQIELWIKDEQVDFFTLDLEAETVEIHVEKCAGVLLGMRGVYEDYIKLIADLGIEIPKSYRRHWTPKTEQKHYYIDFEGDICPNGISSNFGYNEVDRRRCENFNMFPTRELAEKGKNLSKLGRLILLWQYANDCLFEPDWKNNDKKIYCIKFDHINKEISYYYNIYAQLDTVYFQTKEQAKAFIKMYSEEIKKIMGVI